MGWSYWEEFNYRMSFWGVTIIGMGRVMMGLPLLVLIGLFTKP